MEGEAQVEDDNRRYSKQKKRTIMGEEKTGSNFVVVSVVLLAFLLLYPCLVIIVARTAYRSQQYSITATSEIIRFEKEMAKLNSFIVTPIPLRIPITLDPPTPSPTATPLR